LSQKFEVNAVTISKWKSEFLANLSATFSNVKETENSEPEVPVEKLYAQIGKLKVEPSNRRCSIDGGLATRTGISNRTKARKKDVQVDGAWDHLSQKKSDERRS